MSKEKNKNKNVKKRSLLYRIYRFFIPKNFKEELVRGRVIGEQLKQGKVSPKVVPTWWLGKGVRKVVDPKHKAKIGKGKTGGKNGR